MSIGERIKERRIQLNMSQDELASKLGYSSRSSINKIELGINDITQSKVIDFANALQTTPAYLMEWDEAVSNLDPYGLDKSKMIKHLGENQELVEIYKNIVDNENLLLLFDKAKDLSESDLKAVLEIINAINKSN
ncbi:MAG: helix-turn-helix transcriptional regulator [Bacilli bacterium]